MKRAFMLPRDIGLFVRSARTDARIKALSAKLGQARAIEAVYAADPDPWASASPRYRYQRRKYEVLASLLPRRRFGRALDLGCGPGLLSRHLSDVADSVVGVDIAPSAIEVARLSNSDRENMVFEAHDLLELPTSFDASFDLVVIADVLYYLSPMEDAVLLRVVERIAALVTPGGLCLLANHFFFRFDPESKRSRRIHDAFRSSRLFESEKDVQRPFYLATLMHRTGCQRHES
jgi:SAM-dependent methyltransferase